MVYNFGNPFPPSVGSFQVPVPPPDSDPDDGEQAVVCFSQAWQPYVLGALQQLTLQATWQGDDDTVLLAQSRAQDLLDQFSQAESLCPDIMVIHGLHYDVDLDILLQTTDGGVSYHEAEGYDPRHNTLYQYPAIEGDDPQCHAAANMTRWLNNLIDETVSNLSIGMDAGGLVTLVAGLLLDLGPFGILIDLIVAAAFGLFSAGATALSAAFTNEVYDQLQCIFYCHIEPDGTVTPDELAAILSDIDTRIGGLVSATMSAMLFLMGEVGLTNAGTRDLGEPVDCSGCDCDWCYRFDFTLTDGGFTAFVNGSGTYGTWVSGVGWRSTYFPEPAFHNVQAVIPTLEFDETTIHEISWEITFLNNSAPEQYLYSDVTLTNFETSTSPWTGSEGWDAVALYGQEAYCTSTQYVIITAMTFRGTGVCPFGTPNC